MAGSMPHHDALLLGTIVVDLGFASASTVDGCLAAQRDHAGEDDPPRLADLLVERGCVTRHQADAALKEQERRIATAVVGPYRLVRRIGHGNMGWVYEAKVEATGARVALKRLLADLARRPSDLARFRREATIGMEIAHPHIVSTLDFGEDDAGPYLVMELVPGGSLSERLRRNGPMAERDAIGIALKLLAALGYAHERGLVHRDVKPANVLFDARGEPKLSDFGLVKPPDEESAFSTAHGQMVGTPHYVAPEQIRADPGVDGRADLYALGCTLFHLLVGHPPFPGRIAVDVMHRHLEEAAPDPRGEAPAVGEGCAQVVRALMIKDPRRRYATPDAVAADLERVQRGRQPVLALNLLDRDGQGAPRRPRSDVSVRARSRATAGGAPRRVVRALVAAPRRTPTMALGIAVGVLLLAALLLVVLFAGGSSPPPSPPSAPPAPAAAPAPDVAAVAAPPAPAPDPEPPAAPAEGVRLAFAIRTVEADVDLGVEGSLDWVHLGLQTAQSIVHRGDGGRIAVALVGTDPLRIEDHGRFTWRNGGGVFRRATTSAGVAVAGAGNGFRLVLPAGTRPRTARLYVGLRGARGHLAARLSDGSAAPIEDRSLDARRDREPLLRCLELTYRAGANRERLEIAWTADAVGRTDGAVSLAAVTLAQE